MTEREELEIEVEHYCGHFQECFDNAFANEDASDLDTNLMIAFQEIIRLSNEVKDELG